MGRKLHTNIPIILDQLKPKLPNSVKMKKNEDKERCRQKRHFDTEHKARDLKPLMIGDSVYIKDLKTRVKVLKLARRNHRHLSYIETETNVEIEPQEMREYLEQDREVDIPRNPADVNIIPPRSDNGTYVTRYGRVVREPTQFGD